MTTEAYFIHDGIRYMTQGVVTQDDVNCVQIWLILGDIDVERVDGPSSEMYDEAVDALVAVYENELESA